MVIFVTEKEPFPWARNTIAWTRNICSCACNHTVTLIILPCDHICVKVCYTLAIHFLGISYGYPSVQFEPILITARLIPHRVHNNCPNNSPILYDEKCLIYTPLETSTSPFIQFWLWKSVNIHVIRQLHVNEMFIIYKYRIHTSSGKFKLNEFMSDIIHLACKTFKSNHRVRVHLISWKIVTWYIYVKSGFVIQNNFANSKDIELSYIYRKWNRLLF